SRPGGPATVRFRRAAMTTQWPAGLPPAPRLRGLTVLLGALAIHCSDPAIATAGPETAKLVVVLYPDDSARAPRIILANRAIRSPFDSQSPGHIDIRNEYVDASRSRDADFMQAQVSLLRRKYTGRKVDLVIAALSSGLDFALEHRAALFPGVPIVFV